MDTMPDVYAAFKRKFDAAFGISDYKHEATLKATISVYRTHKKHSLFVFITDEQVKTTRTAWAFATAVASEEEAPHLFDNTTYRYCCMGDDKPSFYVDFGKNPVTCAMVNQVVAEVVATDLLSMELADAPVRQKIVRNRSLSGLFACFPEVPVLALHITRDLRKTYTFMGLDFLIMKGDMACLSNA